MNRLTGICLTIVLAAAIPAAFAQPSELIMENPDSHRLVVENDYVRVLELQLGPGAALPMHTYPPRVVVALNPSRIKLTSREGQMEIKDEKPGDVFWYDATSQALEVVAGTLHEIETEIKPASPPAYTHTAKDMTEITPQLAHVLFENARLRVVDLRGEAGQQYPFHFHPPRVGIRLEPARMKIRAQNGTTSLVDFHVGEATWGNFVEHTDAVVLGSFHMVMIELKPQERPQ